jgi:hypothetical protein
MANVEREYTNDANETRTTNDVLSFGESVSQYGVGDCRHDVVVVRVTENHSDQPSNNVTTAERELCGDGSPQYLLEHLKIVKPKCSSIDRVIVESII